MLTTADLLAQAKAAQGIPSNYRLARVLDVPESTIQRWNTGRGFPGDDYTAKLAELAGIDPGLAIASIHVEKAPEGAALRSVWVGIAKRLERAGVAAAACALLWGFTGGPDAGAMAATGAQSRATPSTAGTPCILCKL